MCLQDQSIIRLKQDSESAVQQQQQCYEELKAVQSELSTAQAELHSKLLAADNASLQLAESQQEVSTLQLELSTLQQALHALRAVVGTAQQAHAEVQTQPAAAQTELGSKQMQLRRLGEDEDQVSQSVPDAQQGADDTEEEQGQASNMDRKCHHRPEDTCRLCLQHGQQDRQQATVSGAQGAEDHIFWVWHAVKNTVDECIVGPCVQSSYTVLCQAMCIRNLCTVLTVLRMQQRLHQAGVPGYVWKIHMVPTASVSTEWH